MTFRYFTAAEEDHAASWADLVESEDPWSIGLPIGLGESQSFHIDCSEGRRGACKPAHANDGTPRAAHEKIAADLAYRLQLPVPAVCLWKNPATGDLFAVSAWAFRQVMTWGEVSTRLSSTFMQNAAPAFSAARVLHTWIGDTDHGGNPGTVLVDIESDEDHPRVAFIDHAFSMSQNAEFASKAALIVPSLYIPDGMSHAPSIKEAIENINQMEATMVETIVRRVPATFLPSDKAEAIISGLLKRRTELAGLFGVVE
jgi:hypothetical protein